MIHDSNRKALRRGLPWIFVGYLVLGGSIGLWTIEPVRTDGVIATSARVSGALGSGLFLIGLVHFARARIALRLSPWFVLAFVLWLAKFSLRMFGFSAGSDGAPAIRLLLAAGAALCLTFGMLWVWDGREPEGQRETWIRTRALFLVQLAAIGSLFVTARIHELRPHEAYRATLEMIPLGLGAPLCWLLFIGPYAHLALSLRRTIQDAGRRHKTTELLTS